MGQGVMGPSGIYSIVNLTASGFIYSASVVTVLKFVPFI